MSSEVKRHPIGVRLNFWLLAFTKNWLNYALVLLGVYVSLPVIAPVLMQAGLDQPARIIYTLYSPMCHQFAFRSTFLFGEQAFYPRYNVGSELVPFETYVFDLPEFDAERVLPFPWGQVGDIYNFTSGFQGASKEFLGNKQMGFKVAICTRDISIYGTLFLGAVIYRYPPVRRRLRPCPIYLYGILGLSPIAIDGLSQLLSYPSFNFWTPRETLPIFRVITGVTFGITSAWLAFPYINVYMEDTRRQIESKLRRAGLLVKRLEIS